MTRKLFAAAASGLLLMASVGANAVILSVTPVVQTVDVGDSVTVDISISGLSGAPDDSLGAFDLDVLFDDTVIVPDSLVFGTDLALSIQDVFGFNPVNVIEVSLEVPLDLDIFQPDDFLLFSLTFIADSPGTSAVTLGVIDLSDSTGLFPLFVDAIETASITVNAPQVVPMPEPSTLAVLALGLLGASFARRRRAH